MSPNSIEPTGEQNPSDGDISSSPTASQLPDIPGFVIERELGRGGMGVVYLARQVALNRPVALKMLLNADVAQIGQLQRFLLEATSQATLHHPHIVMVHGVDHHSGRLYMVMEYVSGGSLRDLLNQNLTPRQAAQVLERLARAMTHAHKQGIIHRDLKPDNVLLAPASPDDANSLPGIGVPKISDFGLARFIDADNLTATGTVLGTPGYMAPEQARGETNRIGPTTDVWALGGILYTLLSGRSPFEAKTPWMTVLSTINEPPQPLPTRDPPIPDDLIAICMRCLEKNPDRRYLNAQMLGKDLRRFLADQPLIWNQNRRKGAKQTISDPPMLQKNTPKKQSKFKTTLGIIDRLQDVLIFMLLGVLAALLVSLFMLNYGR